MKMVYESSTALEAHMVKNLLEAEGIESRIDGEYLQGGVGALQAIGIVRLMVQDSDYLKAREIIDQWESKQETEVQKKPRNRSGTTKGFIIGAVLTAGIAFWITDSPVTNEGIDYNGDGILDEKWFYKNNKIDEVHVDRNFDKTYDAIHQYDKRGLIRLSKLDDDFNGVFETKIYYHGGKAAYEESDKDQNGKIDYRVNYKYGVLDNIEFIDDRYGRIRKRQFFRLGKLVSADYDSNRDGKFRHPL